MKRRTLKFAAVMIFVCFMLSCNNKESKMDIAEIQDRIEIRELTDLFANYADTKEIDKQVELFAEDGYLEFQMGFDGEVKEIRGKKALFDAFTNTVVPCKAVYHLNGQQTLTSYSKDTAEGTAYCQAMKEVRMRGRDL